MMRPFGSDSVFVCNLVCADRRISLMFDGSIFLASFFRQVSPWRFFSAPFRAFRSLFLQTLCNSFLMCSIFCPPSDTAILIAFLQYVEYWFFLFLRITLFGSKQTGPKSCPLSKSAQTTILRPAWRTGLHPLYLPALALG